jgi:hypothetical protein
MGGVMSMTTHTVINAYLFGAGGGGAPITSTIWQVVARASEENEFTASEIRFFPTVGASAEGDSGTSATTYSLGGAINEGTVTYAWDSNVSTAMTLIKSSGIASVERTFDSPVACEELLMRSCQGQKAQRTPTIFDVNYWNGSAFVRHFTVYTTPWALATERRFAPTDYPDPSDEVGGHRFWFIKFIYNQNNGSGADELAMSAVRLRNGTTDVGRVASHTYDSNPTQGGYSFFDEQTGSFAYWVNNTHWIGFDLGYARVVDNIQLAARADGGSYTYQLPKTGEVRYGSTDVFADSTLHYSFNDTGGAVSNGEVRTHTGP